MNVLLAVDGSRHSNQALEAVMRLSTHAEVQVHLVHVMRPLPQPPVLFPDVFSENDLLLRDQYEKQCEAEAGQQLERHRQTLPGSVPVTQHLLTGDPSRTLLALCEQIPFDLVVMGARGQDSEEDNPQGVGHLVQKMVRYAHAPVWAVRSSHPQHALVCVGPSDLTGHLLEDVAHSQWLAGCRLTLAQVIDDRYLDDSRVAASQFAGSQAYLERLRHALLSEARQELQQAATGLEQRQQTRIQVLEGFPARTLLAYGQSTGADLLVLGQTRHHTLGHLWLGGTAQYLLRHSRTSVLVYPEQPEATP